MKRPETVNVKVLSLCVPPSHFVRQGNEALKRRYDFSPSAVGRAGLLVKLLTPPGTSSAVRVT